MYKYYIFMKIWKKWFFLMNLYLINKLIKWIILLNTTLLIEEVNQEIEVKVKKKKYKMNNNNINIINKENLMKKIALNKIIIDILYIYFFLF